MFFHHLGLLYFFLLEIKPCPKQTKNSAYTVANDQRLLHHFFAQGCPLTKRECIRIQASSRAKLLNVHEIA